VKNGAHKIADREPTRLINKELSDLWKIPTHEGHSISESFRPEEFAAALRHLKPRKRMGLHLPRVYTPRRVGSQILVLRLPQFLHAPTLEKSTRSDSKDLWRRALVVIPKIWRRALVVAIPKPEKPLRDPKRYRAISLLCVPFKILERLIYARVETITDPLLPQEQAGFCHGRSAVDLVTLLTQDIEDSFSAKKKARAVFVDLTAA